MNIQEFLRAHPMRGFVFNLYKNRGSKMIANRILVLYGFATGNISLHEALLLLLPTRFKSRTLRTKMLKFRDEKISEEAKSHIKKYINNDGSVNVFGHPFYPAEDNYGELMEFLSEVIAHDQYKAREYLKNHDVVIDAGANIGSFSILCSNIKQNVAVYAFEPVSKTFNVLKSNTQAYPNIHCQQIGLSDKNGRQKIYFGEGATAGSTFNFDEKDESNGSCFLSEEVNTETIDSFVARNAINRVDIIKMDTEGFEFEILTGARETIKKFSPVIMVSAYHKPGDNIVLPELIKSIDPAYEFKLLDSREADMLCYVRRENK